MPVPSSQGTTFTFGGVTFAGTNIKVKKTGKGYDQRVDVSTLDLADGADKVYEDPPLFDYGSEGRKIEISLSFLGDDELTRCLKPLAQVGLGYLPVGQPLNTLSGGESQRLKLAEAVARVVSGALFVLDEPTAGLHPEDVTPLLALFDELVRAGATLVVIEHDMRVVMGISERITVMDYGEVIAEGTPKQVMANEKSLTGGYLSGRLEIAPTANTRPRREAVERCVVLLVRRAG